MMTQEKMPPINQVNSRKICMIENERAAENPDLLRAIDLVRSRGGHIDLREITVPGEGVHLAAQAAQEGYDVLVAAGGDGTLNEVLNGIFLADKAEEVAVGVMPYGTANDFAVQCTASEENPMEALLQFTEGEATYIDIGKMNNRYFINLASGGYGAEVTTETPTDMKHLLGGFSYFLTGLGRMLDLSAKKSKIIAPDFEWQGDLLALSVGNGRQAGGGFRACPRAVINDGLFDVLIIPDIHAEDLIPLVRDLIRLGTHIDHEHVIYFQTPWLRIESHSGLQVNLDGEPVEDKEFYFENLERKLAFFLSLKDLLQKLE